jgi:hypothetical protein
MTVGMVLVWCVCGLHAMHIYGYMLVGGCECYSVCDRVATAGISAPPLTKRLRIFTVAGYVRVGGCVSG